jgi:hypothetical protein
MNQMEIMMKKWLTIGTAALLVAVIASTAVVAAAQNGMGGPGMGGPGGQFGPGRDGGRGRFGFGGDLMTILAEQLSMEEADVRTELQAGKTIAELAAEHDVDTAALIDAFLAPQQETLTAAVGAGNLTQAQADARLELARVNAEVLLTQTFTLSARDGLRGDGLLSMLTEQLGMEQAELVTAIQEGTTIAELAEANNVETSAIVDAVVAAQQERLTAAVEDGRLTQAQADAQLELARANAEAMLDQPLNIGRGGRGGRDGFGGPGGHGGFPGMPGALGDAPDAPATEPDASATPNV